MSTKTFIDASSIAKKVYELTIESGHNLRGDVLEAIKKSHGLERSEAAKRVLELQIQNAEIAPSFGVPLCQDTGTAWVYIEKGPDVCIEGDLENALNDAVARAYKDGGLRMSIVRDALVERTNTQNNTPIFFDVIPVDEPGLQVTVMLKGAGSDNASRLEMLTPDQGFEGVKELVMKVVEEKATMACPPLVIGIGVGATFDKVGGLSKKALLRKVGEPNPDARVAALEEEILKSVNGSGFGAGGLGGDITALAVHINTAATHIAALPVAVNLGCSAMRSAKARLV